MRARPGRGLDRAGEVPYLRVLLSHTFLCAQKAPVALKITPLSTAQSCAPQHTPMTWRASSWGCARDARMAPWPPACPSSPLPRHPRPRSPPVVVARVLAAVAAASPNDSAETGAPQRALLCLRERSRTLMFATLDSGSGRLRSQAPRCNRCRWCHHCCWLVCFRAPTQYVWEIVIVDAVLSGGMAWLALCRLKTRLQQHSLYALLAWKC